MKLRKTQLAAAVGAALLAGGTAAQAQTAPAGQVTPSQQVQVQLYGQVNRAMMWADNDVQNKWFFVDGQPSSTRFGIFGQANVSPTLRAGARIETEIRSNRSNQVTFSDAVTTGTDLTQTTFTERWMDVFLGGSWGQINLGQGSGAADGTMEVDLSGIDLALSNPMNDFGGAIPFSSGGLNTAITPDTVMNNLDALSRYDRVMYTTPTFGGFRAQVGYGQQSDTGEAIEASLWWAGKFAGELQAAIGWVDQNVGPDHLEHIGGSVSWLHTSGFNVSAAYGDRDLGTPGGNRSAKHYNAQVGYKWGQHAIAVKYEQTDDFAATGDEGTGYGIGYVWNPVRWAEFYVAYMLFSLDHQRPGVGDLEDIMIGAIGTRLRF
jgi:hypothetical protein